MKFIFSLILCALPFICHCQISKLNTDTTGNYYANYGGCSIYVIPIKQDTIKAQVRTYIQYTYECDGYSSSFTKDIFNTYLNGLIMPSSSSYYSQSNEIKLLYLYNLVLNNYLIKQR